MTRSRISPIPSIGDQHDAPLWRALAYAEQGKWAQARDGFKSAEAAVATLPVELQRVALKDEMRSAIEVGDFSTAADQLNDFETIGVPHELEPAIAVLIGRLAEGMGRIEDALAAYQTAADSRDRRAAAQGQLRETLLRYALGDLKRDDVIRNWKRSPPSGAATRPRSRRCKCWRGSTPRRAAIATRSMSCAARSRRIPIPT